MAEAFLIGVKTPIADAFVDRRLYVVLADSSEKAIQAVRDVWPQSDIEDTGIPVLPETIQKLGLSLGQSRQL